MKNILLLTNIYPNNDPQYSGTSVCHYYTVEWMKMGYNVKVIHFESLFPRIYYLVGRIFNNYIQAKTGCVTYTKTKRFPFSYKVDDIPVLFIPIKKIIPHKRFSKKRMQIAFDYLCTELKKDNFVPDAVVGHFLLPQLEFLHLFKQKDSNVKTCMVLHSSGETIPKVYGNEYKDLMKSVDLWGFRSIAFKNRFESIYGKQKKEFLCYSGVPAIYLKSIKRDFSNGIKKFIFVGSLYKLKRVEDSILALHNIFNNKEYSFDIIGDGAESSNLKSLISTLGEDDCIHLLGKQKRDDAQDRMSKSDCFIMVSAHEAFGLVYIEAMAKGCIVIATRGQGIDGIIKHGYNGFLCEANNPTNLEALIREIISLSSEELNRISYNAVATASNFSNKQVALDYINAVIS